MASLQDELLIAVIIKAVKAGSGGQDAELTPARFKIIQDRVRRWCDGPVDLYESYYGNMWKAMVV